VGEQVPYRRAFRPGRLVQVDRSFLRGHEGRVRDEQLRHGAPAEAVLDVAPLRDDGVGGRDARGVVAGGPLVDLAEGIHGGRY
jgi:hypothetical protein